MKPGGVNAINAILLVRLCDLVAQIVLILRTSMRKATFYDYILKFKICVFFSVYFPMLFLFQFSFLLFWLLIFLLKLTITLPFCYRSHRYSAGEYFTPPHVPVLPIFRQYSGGQISAVTPTPNTHLAFVDVFEIWNQVSKEKKKH